MTDQQKSAELYRIAYQCASVYDTCNHVCNTCPYCTLHYTNEQDALLIMAGAKMDYHRHHAEESGHFIAWLVSAIFMLGLAVLLILGICWCVKSVKRLFVPPKQPVSISRQLPTKVERQIRQTRDVVAQQLFDVNGDKLLNCIDYAIMFCAIYPKSKVIYNQHGTMNHAFNAVWVDEWGTYIYIEPQNRQKILMEDVWGRAYDPTYNEEKTGTVMVLVLMASTFGIYPPAQAKDLQWILDQLELRLRGE